MYKEFYESVDLIVYAILEIFEKSCWTQETEMVKIYGYGCEIITINVVC